MFTAEEEEDAEKAANPQVIFRFDASLCDLFFLCGDNLILQL